MNYHTNLKGYYGVYEHFGVYFKVKGNNGGVRFGEGDKSSYAIKFEYFYVYFGIGKDAIPTNQDLVDFLRNNEPSKMIIWRYQSENEANKAVGRLIEILESSNILDIWKERRKF